MSLKRKGTSKKVLAAMLALTMMVSAAPLAPIASAEAQPGNPELARQAATEGMVLLQNNNDGLPIPQGGTVALFGQGQIDYVKGGWGSGDVNVPYVVNILQGMQNKEKEGKLVLNKTLVDAYTAKKDLTLTKEMVDTAAGESDTAVVVISRNSGEGSDRGTGKGDYLLSDTEEQMLSLVCAAGFDHVAVVLNIGGIIDTKWIAEHPEIDSVLNSWQSGMEGGNAVADVLCGDVNPSGKLTDTWAKNWSDYPSSDNFFNSNAFVNYEEDVFVGYRYFETFDPTYEKVSYPFGYGLSYTTFDISDVEVTNDEENVNVSATVTNTGDTAGKEVVQVYFSAPQMGEGTAKLGKPAKELAAYDKTDLLEPDASQTLEMSFPIDDMSSYDDKGVTGHKSAYVLEAGGYDIYVGNSIQDAGEKAVRGTYTAPETVVTEQLTEQMAPSRLEKRLLADGSYEDMHSEIVKSVSATEPTKLEAEDYASAHSAVAVESFDGGKCVAYMDSASDHRWVEYALNVEEAGTYSVQLRMANGYADIVDMATVTVEGRDQGVKVDLPKTGDGNGKSEWYNFIDLTPFEVKLPKGRCTLRITAKLAKASSFGNFDYMTLNMVKPEEGYAIAADGTSKVEGEAFFGAASSVRIEDCVPNKPLNYKPQEGDTVISTLAYMNYEGNWATYYLNVAEAGTYDVNFSMSNGRAEIADMMKVYVDGKLQPDVNFTLPQTGDGEEEGMWYNFDTFGPIQVTLPQGLCQFKLVSNGLFGNVDYMEFTKAASPAAKASEEASNETAAPRSNAKSSRAASGTKDSNDGDGEDILLLRDVYNGDATMKDFVAQLSNDDLAYLSQGHSGKATGIIGGLYDYGIPGAQTTDGPAGVRADKATAWPCSTNLASAWDTDLAKQVGEGVAKEAISQDLDIWLAPGMNIHRNPMCGRNFEYYSEDPLLTGKTAAAITEGVQSKGVSITLKHFAANNKEGNRNGSDSRMSERALREIYLKGFEIAVKEADPWSIMSSYNYINGTETSESYELLTDILRGEWGYKGMVMTDWGNDSTHWKEAKAGNDVKMPSGSSQDILDALERGDLTREELVRNVIRTLEMIMKTPAMEREMNPPEPTYTTISATEEVKVKATDYYTGTVGSNETCEDEDGGQNPTHTDAGTWMKYGIDVEAAGTYQFIPRVAVNSGGGFELRINGKSIGGVSSMANTGGWQNWTTLDPIEVKLPAGQSILQFYCTAGGFNLNWFKFVPVALDDVDVNVNFHGKDVDLSVNGEAQTGFVDNTGMYTTKTQPGEALALHFVPDVAGKEFRGVTINDEAAEITDTQQFNLDYVVKNQGNTLNFVFDLVDKTTLRTLIDIAETCKESDEYANVVPAVKEAFDKALEKAVTVEADPAATQEDIDNAWIALLDKIQMLSFAQGDTTYLKYLVSVAESVVKDDFTAESVAAMEEALENAQALLEEEPNVLEEDVKAAEKSLKDALEGMVRKADKNTLNSAIQKAEAIAVDIEAGKYLPEGQAAFKDALAAAKEVYDDPDAAQKAIQDAVDALSDAMADLRLVPNKDALKALVEDLEAMDLSKYTTASRQALEDTINQAKAILDDPNASQEEITGIEEKLHNNEAALEIKTSGGSGGNKGGSSGGNKPSGNTSGEGTAVAVANGAAGVTQKASVVSDTTVNFTLKRGAAYCFKMTVVNGSAVPNFTVGNGNILKTQFVAQSGSVYYYRVYAVGAPGQSTGVYTTLPGQNAQQHCTVSIGG